MKKGHITKVNRRVIDWETAAKGCKMLTWERSKWFSKWISGICGVGKQLKLWKWQNHSKCPRCLAENETVSHVLQCQQNEALNLWNTSIADLRQWMTSRNCKPDMCITICNSLEAWHDESTLTRVQTPGHNDIVLATREQDDIGWNGFFNGFISKKWMEIQTASHYLDCIIPKNNLGNPLEHVGAPQSILAPNQNASPNGNNSSQQQN